MQLNGIDLGYNPVRVFDTGQRISVVEIEGGDTLLHPRGASRRQLQVKAWINKGSQAANEMVARQLEEMDANPFMHPVYITFSSARALPHDGWYLIEQLRADYKFTGAGSIPVDMSLILLKPASNRFLAIYTAGGAMPTNFGSVAPVNAVGLPKNAQSGLAVVTRTGAEGSYQVAINPAANPAPFQVAAVTDALLGNCRVYDTMGTPVPTDGTTYPAAWVEVKGNDHTFTGDVVLTNGLILMQFTIGASNMGSVWLWNPLLVTPAWQNTHTHAYADSANVAGVLRNIGLRRVGWDEVAVDLEAYTANGNVARGFIRIQRGRRDVRARIRSITESLAGSTTWASLTPLVATTPWVVANPAQATDQGLVAALLAPQTTYNWAVVQPRSSIAAANKYLAGFLLVSQSSSGQGAQTLAGVISIGTAGPAKDSWFEYGFYVTPFDATTLQKDAATGTLSGGFASTADAGGSTANAAKLTSGAVAGGIALFGSIPTTIPAGTYNLYVRARTTANTSAVAQMRMGLWNPTTAAYVASTTYAPNAWATTYGFKLVSGNITIPQANALAFRCDNTATIDTDWWLDEAILVPVTLTATAEGPQDLGNQYLFDRTARLVVT